MTPTDFRWQELATEAKVRPPHVFMLWHWLSAGAPVEGFAKFAGLDAVHVERMLAALEKAGIDPAPTKAPKRRRTEVLAGSERSTRLPDVFQAPQEWIDYAQQKRHWALADIHTELDKFTNWAHSQGIVRKNWLATWRNWCLGSHRTDGIFVPSVSPILDDERRWIIEERARLNSGPWNAEGELEWVRRRDLAYAR